MIKTYVPPIKSQGIKTKLVPWIKNTVPENFNGTWIEPFSGTGVVAFNIAPNSAILSDTNPHLINFYQSINSGAITPSIVRTFLQDEGKKLEKNGSDYYYDVRKRFNELHAPLDFLFLNRSCFNGMMRFNGKGGFNVPFCKKENRFAQSYVTKIVNQVDYIYKLLRSKSIQFICQDFQETIKLAKSNDIIYCDPPYIGRHTDYFNGWDEGHEMRLFDALGKTPANFILSTWYKNDYRENLYIKSIWSKYQMLTKNHYYHVGGKETNRNPMIEALITNLDIDISQKKEVTDYSYKQMQLESIMC